MILRMSSLFVRTLRDDPADAEVASHKLLVRAGYIRRVAPGIYTWLPLGLRVLRKVEGIVREEMESFGAQELTFPALLPREPYEATGRWTEYGDGLFRLKDRKDADYLLGPTHEEMFTLAVKDLYSSYKDLPVSLYQIQTKYRDEARPRAGLLRGREFIMKDSYSFDIDDAGLEASYQAHRDAYVRIFDRLGFEYVVVKAMSGAMGGSRSEEFLAKAAIGEDTFVECKSCGYAANVEAVSVRMPEPLASSQAPSPTVVDTPGASTIASLVDFLNAETDRSWSAADTLKIILFSVTYPDGRTEDLAIGVPGDREVDVKRLEAFLGEGVAFEPFGEDDFKRNPTLVKGYIGPAGIAAAGITYLVDPRVADYTAWVSGADEHGRHVKDLVVKRDFTPDGVIEVADVRDGDPCPNCAAGSLVAERGIEMGHIFQLGRKYADALDLKVLDENGKLTTVTMGSYGIGVTRAVAVIAEGTHDDLGLCWPKEVAPADVHVVVAGKDEVTLATAETVVADLSAAGLAVLFDDRPKVSPGVKFKDAELIGVPVIVTIGRGAVDGLAEVKGRSEGEKREVPFSDLVAQIRAAS